LEAAEMSGSFVMFFHRTKDFLRIAIRVWRDQRVPVLARIYVVLAPLYWINPFDLIPDLQPGGCCDDLVIGCLLIAMAFRLVPEAVFRDARKASNPAVCGVMFVSLLGLAASTTGLWTPAKQGALNQSLAIKQMDMPNHAVVKTLKSQSCKFKNIQTLADNEELSNAFYRADASAIRTASGELLAARGDLKCQSYSRASIQEKQQSRQIHAKNQAPVRGPHWLANVNESSVPSRDWGILPTRIIAFFEAPVFKITLPAFLRTRGGQRQVFSNEDGAIVLMASQSSGSLEMPPQIVGGFFVAETSHGKDLC